MKNIPRQNAEIGSGMRVLVESAQNRTGIGEEMVAGGAWMSIIGGMPVAKCNKPDPIQAAEPLSARQKLFVDLLPQYNWGIVKAGIAAGFSPSYCNTQLATRCKSDPRLSKAIASKRAEIVSASGWTVEKWAAECAEMYQRAKDEGDWPGVSNMLKMMGMHLGVFEADNRQRQSQIGMVIM